MDNSLKYCPTCEKDVETKWKYGRERCAECMTGLDKNPIDFKIHIPLDNAEISRRNVIKMVNEGILSEKDIK